MVTESKIIRSMLRNAGIRTGDMRSVIPKIQEVLNIFDSTLFPIARSMSFFRTAIIPVASSGNDVPRAIIVADILNSLSPSCCVIKTAPSTTHLPPKYNPASPIAIIKNILKLLCSAISGFLSPIIALF